MKVALVGSNILSLYDVSLVSCSSLQPFGNRQIPRVRFAMKSKHEARTGARWIPSVTSSTTLSFGRCCGVIWTLCCIVTLPRGSYFGTARCEKTFHFAPVGVVSLADWWQIRQDVDFAFFLGQKRSPAHAADKNRWGIPQLCKDSNYQAQNKLRTTKPAQNTTKFSTSHATDEKQVEDSTTLSRLELPSTKLTLNSQITKPA